MYDDCVLRLGFPLAQCSSQVDMFVKGECSGLRVPLAQCSSLVDMFGSL